MVVGIIVRKTNDKVPEEQGVSSSELLGRAVYCPLCGKELRGWGEGCTIIHLHCSSCNLELVIANSQVLDADTLLNLEKKLVESFYEAASW